jgi:hypothetical protein
MEINNNFDLGSKITIFENTYILLHSIENMCILKKLKKILIILKKK